MLLLITIKHTILLTLLKFLQAEEHLPIVIFTVNPVIKTLTLLFLLNFTKMQIFQVQVINIQKEIRVQKVGDFIDIRI